jgi:signal transduction histidine kinase
MSRWTVAAGMQGLLHRIIPFLPRRFQQDRMPYLFLFAMLVIGVLMLYIAITPYPHSRGLYMAMAVLLAGVMALVNRGLPLHWAVHIATAAAWLMLLHNAWTTGGIFSPRLAWMLVLPLTPFFMIGRMAGLVWFALVLATQVIIGVLNALACLPHFELGRSHVLSSYVTFSMVSTVLIIVPMIYDRMNAAALARSLADQQELERQRDALEQASEVRERFVAAVSHELRTPMNAILESTALLLSRVQDPPEARQALVHTQQSADHLLTVINDLLDDSQLQTGRLVAHPEVFRLGEVVRRAFELFLPRVRSSHLDYRLVLDPALPPWVRADRHRLMQVLVNLLGNALKFTHQGSVVLRVTWLAPGVLFEVQDTGIGIPPDRQAAVFERFTQADAAIHSHYGGSGLGLAITRQLVHLLQGDIGVDSTEGQGSRFWFRLPLVPSEPPG